jgi:hypothetical protein
MVAAAGFEARWGTVELEGTQYRVVHHQPVTVSQPRVA